MRGEHRQVAIELLEEAAVSLGAHDEKLDEIAKERVEEAAQILGMTMVPTSKEMDNAIQKVFDLFDEWVGITGYFEPRTTHYYEYQKVIESAVRIGAIRRRAKGGET